MSTRTAIRMNDVSKEIKILLTESDWTSIMYLSSFMDGRSPSRCEQVILFDSDDGSEWSFCGYSKGHNCGHGEWYSII